METKITRQSRAGSLESNDLVVMIEPDNGLDIEIKSVVDDLFHDQIEASVKKYLNELGVKDARVLIEDRGALDFTIKARIETAVRRAR